MRTPFLPIIISMFENGICLPLGEGGICTGKCRMRERLIHLSKGELNPSSVALRRQLPLGEALYLRLSYSAFFNLLLITKQLPIFSTAVTAPMIKVRV